MRRLQQWLSGVGVCLLGSAALAQPPKDVNSPEFLEATLRQQWSAIGEDLKVRKIDQAALGHASAWRSGEGAALPTAGRDGRVVFTYGAVLPKIVCTPLRVCDVELQTGERVNNVHVGDAGRWILEPALSGNTVHVVIKPLVANITTNVALYTDRRVYHLELQSSEKDDHMPFVAFSYPEDGKVAWLALQARAEAAAGDSAKAEGGADAEISANPASLFFGYEIEKAGRWRARRQITWAPTRVYDDGEKTVIELPKAVLARELPVLFVRDGDGQDKLKAFRVKGRHFIVDGLFDHAVLVKGVGKRQERVEIHREED